MEGCIRYETAGEYGTKTAKAEPIRLEELGSEIAARRAELGITDADIPRNSG
jgi:hypothetical protein